MQLLITDAKGAKTVAEAPITITSYAPPTKPKIWVGSDRSALTIPSTYPKADVTRWFGPNGLKSLATCPASLMPIVSSKGTTDPAAVGTYASTWKRKKIWCSMHEPDRAVKNGGPDPAVYKKTMQGPMIVAVKNSEEAQASGDKTIAIFMGYAQRNAPDRSYDQFWMDEDYIGFDLEKDNKRWPTGLPPVPDFCDVALQAAKEVGKPLIICEGGYVDPDADKQAQWYQDFFDYLTVKQTIAVVAGVIAYDFPGSTGDYTLTGPSLKVWQDITANH